MAAMLLVFPGLTSKKTTALGLTDIISVRDFGAVGDGVTDDTTAFQNALNNASTNKIGAVLVPPNGKYLINGNLNICNDVTLYSTVSMPEFTYQDMTTLGGCLRLNSSATITMRSGSSLKGLYIVRSGLIYPVIGTSEVARYAGTAITVAAGSHGATIEDCLILGFNKGIYSPTTGDKQRLRVQRVNIDCNNGIEHNNAYDIAYIDQVHCFPFGTIGSAQADAVHQRSGTAFKFTVFGDWHKITNCFSFGYNRGFVISDCNEVTLTNCGADYTPTLGSNQPIGFEILGNSQQIKLINCNSVGNYIGMSIVTTGVNASALIEGCSIFRCSTDGIQINAADGATISNNTIRDCTNNGIAVNGGLNYKIYGNTFKNDPNAIRQNSTTIPVSQWGNTIVSGVTQLHLNPYVVTITTASTINLPAGEYSTVVLNGAGTITAINYPSWFSGKRITFICGSNITIAAGATIRLPSNFVTAPEGTLTLVSNGDAWFDAGRVVR